jgi:hypothetical protein
MWRRSWSGRISAAESLQNRCATPDDTSQALIRESVSTLISIIPAVLVFRSMHGGLIFSGSTDPGYTAVLGQPFQECQEGVVVSWGGVRLILALQVEKC